MATTEEQKEIPENTENPENQENPENPEEEKEEEEPVDLELQKEMKGIKISDSDFTNEPKAKKPYKKMKNPEEKKVKKKGQDFLDYANKNNIQINIQYEENKYQLKKKEGQKFGENNANRFNDNRKQYNRGGFKNDKNRPQKRPQNFNTGNKFDNFGQRPFQQNYNQRPAPKLVENKEIIEYLEKLFGEENLNKDTYIRNRLTNGKILVDDIVNYNDIKKNNINAEKILEIIKDNQNLECVNEEGKNYIKIKDFDKLKLLTLEQIIQNKKAAKMQKMQYMTPMGYAQYPYGYNYINMQNNYFIYNNKYPYSNYQNPGYAPIPENK